MCSFLLLLVPHTMSVTAVRLAFCLSSCDVDTKKNTKSAVRLWCTHPVRRRRLHRRRIPLDHLKYENNVWFRVENEANIIFNHTTNYDHCYYFILYLVYVKKKKKMCVFILSLPHLQDMFSVCTLYIWHEQNGVRHIHTQTLIEKYSRLERARKNEEGITERNEK